MLHRRELRNLPALPEPATEREVRLNHIDGAPIDESLEIKGGVERLAGRDRARAPALEKLISGEVLGSQRLLDPSDLVGRKPRDALPRKVQRVVRVDVDQNLDIRPKNASGGCHALPVIGRRDAYLDLDGAKAGFCHGFDLRLEIARAILGQIAARGVDLYLRGLFSTDQPVNRQAELLASCILCGPCDAPKAPCHPALHPAMSIASHTPVHNIPTIMPHAPS